MIDHVAFEVADLERSGAFYDAVFQPLGWRRIVDRDDLLAWGMVHPVFRVTSRRPPGPGFGHVCFRASGIVAVKAAWEAGVAAGGLSEGKPGGRPQYGPGYYAAYLRDLDGYSIELAVGR